MKNLFKLLPAIALISINACSFANKSTVKVPINSNPPGAMITIDGRNYGQTPALVELKPSKNYKATISKQGYSPVDIDMETWYSIRNSDGGDGGRCLADSLGILPMFIIVIFAPEKCGSFKQDDYFVDLAGRSPGFNSYSGSPVNSMNNDDGNQAPQGYGNQAPQGYGNQAPQGYKTQNTQKNNSSQYQDNYYQNYQQPASQINSGPNGIYR
ncbi:MAG: hypothetical protein ACJAZX_001173 [Rickettsiales bacterium]|jgi:hypothetical protein